MNIIQKMGVVASLILVSSPSMAVVYDLTETGAFEWGSGYIYNRQELYIYGQELVIDTVTNPVASGEGDVSGSFSDSFTFTVPKAPENQVWSFVAEVVNWFGTGVYEFNNLSFQGNAGIDITSHYGGEASIAVGIGSGWWYYSEEEPPIIEVIPGSYTLAVSGMARIGIESSWWLEEGGYELNIMLSSVSPVPEPSSIALMLGGLGLVGFMAARRRNQI